MTNSISTRNECSERQRMVTETLAEDGMASVLREVSPSGLRIESRRGFLSRIVVGGLAVATVPLLEEEADAGSFTPSISEQKKLGAAAARQILAKYPEVHDSRADRFSAIGARLVRALPAQDRATWDYSFHVIESKEVNAFALPGGPMFMFTGLMDHLDTNDQIAAVTGHEMTHVRKQHWAKAYAAQQKRELVLDAALSLFRAGKTLQTVAGLGDQLLTLRFSRKDEDEADAGGLQNMVDAGYNPQGMIDLFHTLETLSGKGVPLAFLSDHPLTSERIKRTQQRIDAMKRRRG